MIAVSCAHVYKVGVKMVANDIAEINTNRFRVRWR